MTTKTSLLRLLSENTGSFVSGETVADSLGVSRAAVSKACQALRDDGYDIESRTNKGYMLKESVSLLTYDGISSNIKVPCELEVYDVVDSTNEAAKKTELSDLPKVIISDRQTAGKGRLGRRFESPAGTGLYMTFVFRPKFDIRRSLFVTMASAVGTARAIEKVTGTQPGIKWVNDLYLNGKKICGILTEAQSDFETGMIDRLITGIGVNCFPGSFPDEIKSIAGSVSDTPGSFSREILAGEMINEVLPLIMHPDVDMFMDEYKEKCFMLGEKIKIHPAYNDSGISAVALDIAEDGGLIVRYLEGEKTGMEEVLHTGEISISL